MTPEILKRIEDLERNMRSLEFVGEISPEIQKAIVASVVEKLRLTDLSDVIITAPSSGQVLKYNGTVWAEGTDNIA